MNSSCGLLICAHRIFFMFYQLDVVTLECVVCLTVGECVVSISFATYEFMQLFWGREQRPRVGRLGRGRGLFEAVAIVRWPKHNYFPLCIVGMIFASTREKVVQGHRRRYPPMDCLRLGKQSWLDQPAVGLSHWVQYLNFDELIVYMFARILRLVHWMGPDRALRPTPSP